MHWLLHAEYEQNKAVVTRTVTSRVSILATAWTLTPPRFGTLILLLPSIVNQPSPLASDNSHQNATRSGHIDSPISASNTNAAHSAFHIANRCSFLNQLGRDKAAKSGTTVCRRILSLPEVSPDKALASYFTLTKLSPKRFHSATTLKSP